MEESKGMVGQHRRMKRSLMHHLVYLYTQIGTHMTHRHEAEGVRQEGVRKEKGTTTMRNSLSYLYI